MIRKIAGNDFDFIFYLYMHPVTNPFLLYDVMDSESFRPIFNDLLEIGIIYVYSDDGNDIGMFKLVPQTYRCSHIVYLGGLAVHPSFAGRGYGYKMMQEIIGFAKSEGFLRIELGVSLINEKAIHLYKKAGFEQEGVLKKYIYLKNENKFLDDMMMAYMV
ncbi:MAG: GNAT family N-acetyltransferase [Bacteroidota bacterium]